MLFSFGRILRENSSLKMTQEEIENLSCLTAIKIFIKNFLFPQRKFQAKWLM